MMFPGLTAPSQMRIDLEFIVTQDLSGETEEIKPLNPSPDRYLQNRHLPPT
jgi:hypothetical protein